VLLTLLDASSDAEVMLYSCRALTYMMEAMPQACGAVVEHGGVGVLCAKLLSIEVIDVAEEALTALEKLSHEHGRALAVNGGLSAVLNFLDFFSASLQRVSVGIAANICRGLRAADFPHVEPVIATLSPLLAVRETKGAPSPLPANPLM
jgi:E3 ubiquitin-protein ligase TRIP12